MKTLIVDDDPFVLEILSIALKNYCGFQGEVKTALNGEDALELAMEHRYDICLLDIGLPGINGIEVMKKLNQISPETRIIIMSAEHINDEKQEAIRRGSEMFLEKPFDLERIRFFLDPTVSGEASKKEGPSWKQSHHRTF